MAEQDITSPNVQKEIQHQPLQPGAEFAFYCVYWIDSATPGCSVLTTYRAKTFVDLPEIPCPSFPLAQKCTSGQISGLAKTAKLYSDQRWPGAEVNSYLLYDEPTYGLLCVANSISGSYWCSYFGRGADEAKELANLGECDPCQGTGNPIHSGIGNKFQAETDAEGALPFGRYYNSSRAARNEALGLNWTHSYARRIEWSSDESSTATLLRGDGSAHVFTLVSGDWTRPGTMDGDLEKLVDGGGQLTGWRFAATGAQETEVYDADGRLTAIERGDGGSVSLEYNEGQTDGNGRDRNLTRVTNAAGRSLYFE